MITTPQVTIAKPISPQSVPLLAADLDAGLRRLKLNRAKAAQNRV